MPSLAILKSKGWFGAWQLQFGKGVDYTALISEFQSPEGT